MEKGICAECGKPLENPQSIGYHSTCADIVYAREESEVNAKFPFVVSDKDGRELERFEKRAQAEDYLYAIQNAIIEERMP